MRSSSRIYSKTNEGERNKPSIDGSEMGESYMWIKSILTWPTSGVCVCDVMGVCANFTA